MGICTKITFNADFNTTISPGLWTHGSPSTWTAMSECKWIFMCPPYGSTDVFYSTARLSEKNWNYRYYTPSVWNYCGIKSNLGYSHSRTKTRLNLSKVHHTSYTDDFQHPVPMIRCVKLIFLGVLSPGIRPRTPTASSRSRSMHIH